MRTTQQLADLDALLLLWYQTIHELKDKNPNVSVRPRQGKSPTARSSLFGLWQSRVRHR
jgi:hypothetical protein